MTYIGTPLLVDQLVLTRGRDFKWTFENLDDSEPPQPVDFPAGDLFFELSTHGEANGAGHIDIEGSNGGTYTLAMDGSTSTALPNDASQAVVKQAIEAFPAVGVGNVSVTGSYTPQWIFTLDWTDAVPLSAGIVELFNQTATNTFNALSWVTGNFSVWLEGHYESSSFVFTLTHKGSLLEQELINFVAGVTGDIIGAINSALSALEQFTGNIADLSLIYAPLRHFDYQFINDKALTPMPAITGTSSLTGQTPTLSVVQDVKGRAPFTIWPLTISGTQATIKVESEDCDAMPDRTPWQLVFLPDGEAAGGEAVARGVVKAQAPR